MAELSKAMFDDLFDSAENQENRSLSPEQASSLFDSIEGTPEPVPEAPPVPRRDPDSPFVATSATETPAGKVPADRASRPTDHAS